MNNYFLAIDIGASSGRHILGHLEKGKLIIEEIHRFNNEMKNQGGDLCWDFIQIFNEIKEGMKKCKEIGKIPYSVAIDTWGVDFVLLDAEDRVIGNTVAYRDSRTKGMDEKVYSILTEAELYARTGIQKQIYNTIYQLMAVKEQHLDNLKHAESFLMIPDYFHFLLSEIKSCEYTNASMTQLVSPLSKDWDWELIRQLGYLTKEIQEEPLYISSGTWSLMGTEQRTADCSEGSKERNLTNEGGYDYRFRYLKNIMGLWMIQSVKREIGEGYSFSQISEMASGKNITSI